jgi:hypothetical protein
MFYRQEIEPLELNNKKVVNIKITINGADSLEDGEKVWLNEVVVRGKLEKKK